MVSWPFLLFLLPDELYISDENILFGSGYVRAYARDSLFRVHSAAASCHKHIPSVSSNIPRPKQDLLIADAQLIREEEEGHCHATI